MQPTVNVDMRTIDDLDNSLALLALLSGRSMEDVIKQASLRAVRSAAVATPKAKPLRKSSRNKGTFGTVAKRIKKGVPVWAIGMVEVWSKGKMEQKFFSTHATFNRWRKKPRVKLAKNAWLSSARAIKQRQVESSAISRMHSTSKVHKKGGNIDSVTMGNNLEYIAKIAPNSAKIAIHKTDKWIQGFALKQVERKMLRQFARGTSAIRGL